MTKKTRWPFPLLSALIALAVAPLLHPLPVAAQRPVFSPPTTSLTSPAVTIDAIDGRFFADSDLYNGTFDLTPTATPVFSARFPVIDFNPPAAANVGCSTTHVDEFSRPFVDVIHTRTGACGTQIAQSSTGALQAGVGALTAFEAVFTTNLNVAEPGQVTFSLFADDAWLLAIGPNASGSQPTYLSGVRANVPNTGPFTGYAMMGGLNQKNMATQATVTVDFPAAGTYPIELDYTECCQGQLALTLDTGFTARPIPPATALPTAPAPAPPTALVPATALPSTTASASATALPTAPAPVPTVSPVTTPPAATPPAATPTAMTHAGAAPPAATPPAATSTAMTHAGAAPPAATPPATATTHVGAPSITTTPHPIARGAHRTPMRARAVCTTLKRPIPFGVDKPAHRVIGGGTLIVRLHSTPRVHVSAVLAVSVRKSVVIGRGTHARRGTRIVVLYRALLGGMTNTRGQFTGRLRVAYTPSAPTQAVLILAAHTGCATAFRNVSMTILPPAAHAHPRRHPTA